MQLTSKPAIVFIVGNNKTNVTEDIINRLTAMIGVGTAYMNLCGKSVHDTLHEIHQIDFSNYSHVTVVTTGARKTCNLEPLVMFCFALARDIPIHFIETYDTALSEDDRIVATSRSLGTSVKGSGMFDLVDFIKRGIKYSFIAIPRKHAYIYAPDEVFSRALDLVHLNSRVFMPEHPVLYVQAEQSDEGYNIVLAHGDEQYTIVE